MKIMMRGCAQRWELASAPNPGMMSQSKCRNCPIGKERHEYLATLAVDPNAPAPTSIVFVPSRKRTVAISALGQKRKAEAIARRWIEKAAEAAAAIAPVEATVADGDEELETSPEIESKGNEMAKEATLVCPGCEREMQRLTKAGVCRICKRDGISGGKRPPVSKAAVKAVKKSLAAQVESVGPGPLTQYLDIHYQIETVKRRHSLELANMEAALEEVLAENPQLADEAKAVLGRIAKG